MTFKVFKRLLKVSIKTTFDFRTTSIIMFIVSILFFGLEVLTCNVLFNYTDTIAGFNKYDYLNLIITQNIISNIYVGMFSVGYYKIINDVLYGKMDYVFIRPINSFLFYVFNGIDIKSFFTATLFILLQISIFVKNNTSILNIFMYIVFLILGIWYCTIFNLFIAMISFYTDKATALFGVNEILEDIGKKPVKIYPKFVRLFLTYIIAYAYVFNAPINILQFRLDIKNAIIYILSCIVLTKIVYMLWFKSIKRYKSSN